MSQDQGGYLALTRLEGEGVTLLLPDGTSIEVYIQWVKWRKVRVAIAAPRWVKIVRNELLKEKP